MTRARPRRAAPGVVRAQRGAVSFALVLGVVLVAAGVFNFHRNWRAEQEELRPFRAYAAADLERLRTAQERELAELRDAYARARGERVQGDPGQLLGERVEGYEAAAAHGRRVRGLGATLAEREAALADLERETALRARDPLRVFLRRLLTLR